MDNLTITLATESDLDQIFDLELESFSSDTTSLSKYKKFLRKKTANVFVVKHYESLIASATVILRQNVNIGRIYTIAVSKKFRGTQVAKKFYDHLEKFCLEKKCKEIQLEVRQDNLAAIRFYEKNGFIKFGEYKKYYEDKKNAWRMRKILGYN